METSTKICITIVVIAVTYLILIFCVSITDNRQKAPTIYSNDADMIICGSGTEEVNTTNTKTTSTGKTTCPVLGEK